jgi:hypothetical protein
MSACRRHALLASAVALLGLVVAPAALALEFLTAPALPTLPAVTLNGAAQTSKSAMTNFSVKEAVLEASGWNVTVAGHGGPGRSAVFAQYCPEAAGCGVDPLGYVSGGRALTANSLTLNTTGASFIGGVGTPPSLTCASGCNVDSASAEKIASAPAGGAGANTWTTTGFSSTSLALQTSSQLALLPASEVYRVDVLWTLSTGP